MSETLAMKCRFCGRGYWAYVYEFRRDYTICRACELAIDIQNAQPKPSSFDQKGGE